MGDTVMATDTTEDTIPTPTGTGEGRREMLIPLSPDQTLTLIPGIATAMAMDMAFMDTDTDMAMDTMEDTIPTATDTGEGRREMLIPLIPDQMPTLMLTLTPGMATMAMGTATAMAITMLRT